MPSKNIRLRALAALLLAALFSIALPGGSTAADLMVTGGTRWQATQQPGVGAQQKKVPILMYHHLYQEEETVPNAISVDQFAEEMAFLDQQGYTTVSFRQLINYVEKGWPLPRKPVCITFDDGYLSNYQLAFPILQEYKMQATIFAIGWSVGATDTYKDTQHPITPHFDVSQAKEMVDSGLVSIQTHTYDMHQNEAYETGDKVRRTILKLPNETEEEYKAALTADITRAREELEAATGEAVNALAYPLGAWDERSDQILEELGIQVTVTTQPGTATLVRGDLGSLRSLPRYGVGSTTTLAEFAALVRG